MMMMKMIDSEGDVGNDEDEEDESDDNVLVRDMI